jgi:hypothetical protein
VAEHFGFKPRKEERQFLCAYGMGSAEKDVKPDNKSKVKFVPVLN